MKFGENGGLEPFFQVQMDLKSMVPPLVLSIVLWIFPLSLFLLDDLNFLGIFFCTNNFFTLLLSFCGSNTLFKYSSSTSYEDGEEQYKNSRVDRSLTTRQMNSNFNFTFGFRFLRSRQAQIIQNQPQTHHKMIFTMRSHLKKASNKAQQWWIKLKFNQTLL